MKTLGKTFDLLNGIFQQTLKPVNFTLNLSEKYVLHLRLPNIVEIGGGFLKANCTEIVDEILHVMVHLHNHQCGVCDFTSNQYHRKEFCDKALDVGLIVAWHKSRGWSITSSDPESIHVKNSTKVRFPEEKSICLRNKIYRLIPIIEIQKFQQQISQKTVKSPKVFQLKYVCSCCPPVIIRSGRRPDGPNPLNVTCNICGEKFEFES